MMLCLSKKTLTYITIGLFFFISGLEYAVMLPTMWIYIHDRYNAEEYFLGMMLSAYSLTDLIFSPVYGRIADKTRKVKYLIFASNLFEIVGNIMYFFGISKWALVASRLITGCGAGAGAAIISEITRTVPGADRTKMLSNIMLLRQLGLIIGPGCNLFLRLCDFKIGQYTIDALTSPGLFMALLFLLHNLAVLLFYTDFKDISVEEFVSPAPVEDDITDTESLLPAHNNEITDNRPALYGSINEEEENSSQEHSNSLILNPDREENIEVNENIISIHTPSMSWSQYGAVFIKDNVVALLTSIFFVVFMQMALEAMLTPLTRSLFHWGELENSFIFLGAGIEVVLVYIGLNFLSRVLHDRWVILGSTILALISLIWVIVYLPNVRPGETSKVPFFIVGVVLDIMSIPPLLVCATSLYSKIIPENIQGISQGFRRSVFALATILGPLWGASSLLNHLYVLFGVLIGCNLLTLIVLLLSFKSLNAS